MEFQFQYGDLIILIGIFLSILLAIAFGIKSKRYVANVWLLGFFIANAILVTVKFLYNTGNIINHPHWFKVNYPVGLLRPVFMYLYVFFLFNETKKSRRYFYLHLAPFFILLIYLTPFFTQNSEYKIAVLNREIINTLGLIPSWYIFFQYLYSIFYLYLIVYTLNTFIKKTAKPSISQRVIINWIKYLIIGSFAYLLISMIIRLSGYSGDYNYYMYEVISVFLIILTIKLLLSKDQISNPSIDKIYKKSNLSNSDKRIYISRINYLIDEENLYLKNDLRLRDISEKLEIPEYLISQVINEKVGKSFRDYLNEFRVRAAQVKLSESHSKYTIEGIAKDVGFNSRSSFYSAFKKVTNLTPLEYIKDNK